MVQNSKEYENVTLSPLHSGSVQLEGAAAC